MVIRKISKASIDAELAFDAPEERAAAPVAAVPTVSELTRRLADTLESSFTSVVVQGEVSGWNRAASGHTYFTLKDDRACLSCVFWKGRSLRHPISEGMKVIATGRIAIYAPRGQYQLDCLTISPLGQGDLQLAFEQLKARLLAEGLFDQDRKKPLPEFPKRIGIVTSRDGAAIRDIVTTLRRRMPSVQVLLKSTLVQGSGSADEIARAIRQMNTLDNIDLLIVGRGGGSAEDLWSFNEEVVARAIADSRIPVISAVGHEIDFTIADFVADLRAPTPTAAAELATRDRSELLAVLVETEEQLTDAMRNLIRQRRHELAMLLHSRGLARPLDMIRRYQQRVDDLSHRMQLGARGSLLRVHEQLRLLESKLHALSPQGVLARGFAIVERDGQPVTRAAALSGGDTVTLRLVDGSRSATIDSNEPQPNEHQTVST